MKVKVFFQPMEIEVRDWKQFHQTKISTAIIDKVEEISSNAKQTGNTLKTYN